MINMMEMGEYLGSGDQITFEIHLRVSVKGSSSEGLVFSLADFEECGIKKLDGTQLTTKNVLLKVGS